MMGVFAFLLFVFGVYVLVLRARRSEMPEDTRQIGARLGRSMHSAVPLPGLMGQAPADFMPEPYRESIGPDESHTLVVDASGKPVTKSDAREARPLGPYRDPALAAILVSEKPQMRRKRRPKAGPLPQP